MSPVATGVRLVLAASLLAGAVSACQNADAYYRNRPGRRRPGLRRHGRLRFPSEPRGLDGPGRRVGPGWRDVRDRGQRRRDAGIAGTGGSAGTTGSAGASGQGGSAGAALSCTTCMVKLQYACRSNDTGQASFVLDVTNEASVSFPLSSLTLRYWYTVDPSVPQMLDCDYAKLGCTNLVTSADTMPAPKFVNVQPLQAERDEVRRDRVQARRAVARSVPRHGRDPAALAQRRLFDDRPDRRLLGYDLVDCTAMQGAAVEWPKITAYLDGVLVWGNEPGPPP